MPAVTVEGPSLSQLELAKLLRDGELALYCTFVWRGRCDLTRSVRSHHLLNPCINSLVIACVRICRDEGVMTMSVGEKAILHITSDYGYGRQGAGGVIPPDADLVGAALVLFRHL